MLFLSLQGQIEYVEYLRSFGKPVVLVLIAGRPRLLHDAVANSDAVINAYVPGESACRCWHTRSGVVRCSCDLLLHRSCLFP